MSSDARQPTRLRLVVACLCLTLVPWADAAVIDRQLEADLATGDPNAEVAIILTFADRVNLARIQGADRTERQGNLVRGLKGHAQRTEPRLKAQLRQAGIRHLRDLWLINGLSLTAPKRLISALSALPAIASIRPDALVEVPTPAASVASLPEWNIDAVRAPDLWALGLDGSGVVVANMDTGVDVNHPDLAGKWRGGINSWYDPHGEHATPYDRNGHGTQTMGIMVGGDAGGTRIGVAPGAQWIAVKLFDDNDQAALSDIHASFQWLLDPDSDSATADAPTVVNASWVLDGTENLCDLEFNTDIEALKTAGISVVFAAGNSGPRPNTSMSPANNLASFAAGAVAEDLSVASFSSRGPSACDGGIYPHVVAPGMNIVTSDLTFGLPLPFYSTVSGTSFAAPHIGGILALLRGAFPDATPDQLDDILIQSALDLGDTGPDDSYGHGLLDGWTAHALLDAANADHPPVITSSAVTQATQDLAYEYQVIASDPDQDSLIFDLDTAPPGMAIDFITGLVTWLPDAAQVGDHSVVVGVTDSTGLHASQAFTLSVENVNDAPVASGDAYSMTRSGVLAIAAPGVLGNDQDIDGDGLSVALDVAPAHGQLVLNGDGSFTYTPTIGFTGTDIFAYHAWDGALGSQQVTVTLSVNPNLRPVANRDVAVTKVDTSVPIAVLDNDFDPDGQLNPASVIIASPPSQGGIVVVNADGTIVYTPPPLYLGRETLRYRVRDLAGRLSNSALVVVRVKP